MSKIDQIKFTQYGTLTAEEWRLFAVCEITTPSPQGGSDKNKEGTPYDSRLGVLENGIPCETCQGDNNICEGHFGYIELPVPIYNKMFVKYILKLLQCVCPHCARSRMLPVHSELHDIMRLEGFERLKAIVKKCENMTECQWSDCQKPLYHFDFKNNEFRRHNGDKKKGNASSTTFKAGEALNIFTRISNETMKDIGFNGSLSTNPSFLNEDFFSEEKTHIHQFRPESLIFTVLPVIPPFSRPFVIRDGQKCDDDLTDKYNSILKACIKLKASNEFNAPRKGKRRLGNLTENERLKTESDLENHIWTLMNNNDEKSKLSSGGRAHKGLYERITGKGGRVQKEVAGKRVDFSARSVIIGGGISIKMNELGIPKKRIAEELTKREIVKEWNIEYAQELVAQKKVNRVIRNGRTIRLNILPDKGCKFNLAIDDVVERQLRDGDIVLFNRQPTLRVESIMAFRAVLVDGYAFRLSLYWTQAYNADYDGDEMNMHIPQSISATAEAEVLMKASGHIMTGQKNGPINGIVQDGLVGSYILTNTWRGNKPYTMVKISVFEQCCFSVGIENDRISDLFNRARKHYPDYINDNGEILCDKIPGKLVSSILFPPNFCYKKVTNVNKDFPIVEIIDGVMLPSSGPLCKQIIGSKSGSVIHILWKEYSPDTSLKFLSETQSFIDYWLPTHGFSMGISDCITTSKDKISNALVEMQKNVGKILGSCDGNPGPNEEAEIGAILSTANNVGLDIAENGMAKGDRNALNIMRNSGAKGSVVNLSQISAFVGQQDVYGNRIPMNMSGGKRALPHFKLGDNSVDARGFVSNNYINGLSPTEAFYHAVTGRIGIIATAIKTAVTGYIQKRISRKIEDLRIEIDGTVRDSIGRIVQFVYGDDGMDPKKLYYAKGVDFPFFVNPVNLANKINSELRRSKGSIKSPRKLHPEEKSLLLEFINYSNFDSYPSAKTTENTRISLEKCLENVKIYEEGLPSFCSEIKNIYETSKAQHGDMVGLIAASSIGEPTTQLSVEKNTLITLKIKRVGFTDIKRGKIGELLDDIFRYDCSHVQVLGPDSIVAFPNVPIFVQTVNNVTENVEWKNISEISRHNANGCLLKITTATGRKVITTLSHSHLQRSKDGFVVSKLARDMVIGDRIPVAKKSFHDVLFKDIPIPFDTRKLKLDRRMGKIFAFYLSAERPKLKGKLAEFIHSLCEKGIPDFFYFSPDEFLSGFLGKYYEKCGFFDCDSGNIGLIFENRLICEQVSYILYRFEVIGEFCDIKGKSCYKLLGNYKLNFLRFMNLNEEEMVLAKEIINSNKIKFDIIPNVELGIKSISDRFGIDFDKINLDREELEEHIQILENYFPGENIYNLKKALYSDVFWDEIVRINVLSDPEDYVYDIGVDGNHTFMVGDGIFVHNTLNTFHTAGVKGKDVSLGVPRFDELLNATKSDNQKKVSCTAYFNSQKLTEISNTMKELKNRKSKLKQDLKLMENEKNENIAFFAKSMFDKKTKLIDEDLEIQKNNYNRSFGEYRKRFEESFVSDFVESVEMKYLKSDVDIKKGVSPVNIITYEEYSPNWWVSLRKDLFGDFEIEPEHWVLIMNLKMDKMYEKNIDIEEISRSINDVSEGKYCCIPSPNFLGILEIFCNYTDIKSYIETKIDLPTGDSNNEEIEQIIEKIDKACLDPGKLTGVYLKYVEPMGIENCLPDFEEYNKKELKAWVGKMKKSLKSLIRSPLVTPDNINFFTCRDVAVNYIKSIKISGVYGVKKIYLREEKDEWIIDMECKSVAINISNKRYLEILSQKDMKEYKTLCDDVHSVCAILGIEAARKFLIEEMTRIISFDGAYINPRHVQLLVDGMTRTGEITPVRRDGISRDQGPITKIMFEQAVDNGVRAAAYTEPDSLQGVSSAIMYGLLAKSGVGSANIKANNTPYIPKNKKIIGSRRKDNIIRK